MEGRRPSKNHLFLALVAGKADNQCQKLEISGRQGLPEPLHCVSRVGKTTDNRLLGIDLGLQHADIGQIAVVIAIIQPIAHHELVRDIEA